MPSSSQWPNFPPIVMPGHASGYTYLCIKAIFCSNWFNLLSPSIPAWMFSLPVSAHASWVIYMYTNMTPDTNVQFVRTVHIESILTMIEDHGAFQGEQEATVPQYQLNQIETFPQPLQGPRRRCFCSRGRPKIDIAAAFKRTNRRHFDSPRKWEALLQPRKDSRWHCDVPWEPMRGTDASFKNTERRQCRIPWGPMR